MMKTYDSYKDSRIEWIGEIPKHWNIIRLSNVFRVSSEKNHPNEMNLSVYRDYGVIPTNSRDDNHNKISEDTSQYKLVEVGDFVMNKMKCWMGSIGLSLYRGIVSPSYTVLKIFNENVFPRYYHSLLRSSTYIPEYRRLSYGVRVGQWDLRFEDFREIPVLLPPLSEQEQIVSYLDEKTSVIDEMVEKKKRKIELLKEYRTSLINTVVTKGLYPDVLMKDSGIEWIGEIPRHWVVKPIKYTVSENQVTLGSNTDDNYELDYVEISDIDSSGNIINKTNYKFIDSPSRCRRVLSKGDVFISTVRTYLRSIGIVETEVRNLICSTGFSVLSPKKNILSKYLFYSVRSEWFISEVVSQSEGVSYPSIQSDKLLSITLTLPPISEQEQIVSYLDEKTSEIDKTIELENKKIELLKEYRQSLISNVVTGKIKVVSE